MRFVNVGTLCLFFCNARHRGVYTTAPAQGKRPDSTKLFSAAALKRCKKNVYHLIGTERFQNGVKYIFKGPHTIQQLLKTLVAALLPSAWNQARFCFVCSALCCWRGRMWSWYLSNVRLLNWGRDFLEKRFQVLFRRVVLKGLGLDDAKGAQLVGTYLRCTEDDLIMLRRSCFPTNLDIQNLIYVQRSEYRRDPFSEVKLGEQKQIGAQGLRVCDNLVWLWTSWMPGGEVLSCVVMIFTCSGLATQVWDTSWKFRYQSIDFGWVRRSSYQGKMGVWVQVRRIPLPSLSTIPYAI